MKPLITLITKKIIKTDIYITRDVEKILKELIRKNNAFLITDIKTKDLLKTKFKDKIELDPSKKDTRTQKELFKFFLRNKVNRSSKIVVVGGGNLSDVTGFCCGVWMRGIDYLIIPTTLLSQIDASIGGKTATDFLGIKNLIGIFHFPKAVIINPCFTLKQNDKSYFQAVGELFKYMIIMDDKYSKKLLSTIDGVIDRDVKSIEEAIKICINFKKAIVEKDPFDRNGIRQILNFGHTIAHALEKTIKISHGDAVFWGCMFELILSIELGFIKERDITSFIYFFKKFAPKIIIDENIFENILKKIEFDKKNLDSSNTFLIKTQKTIKPIKNISRKILKKVWRKLCQKKF